MSFSFPTIQVSDEIILSLEIPDKRIKFYPKLLKRLLRIGVFCVLQHGGYIVILIRRLIIVYQGERIKHKIFIERGSRPLKDGICIVGDFLYYGDYWGNPNRDPVNLYRVNLITGQKEVFYTFNHVRHIHFVQPERNKKNSLLVGTGDLDDESGIYQLDIINKSLSVVGEGAQKWRAVSIIQLDDVLIWGSDDPDGENFIYLFDWVAGSLMPIQQIAGPAYYSTKDAMGNLYIATTVEDRYKHQAKIYCSQNGGKSWFIYKSFKKDIWHCKYFGYGVVEFLSQQDQPGQLDYRLIGLKEI